MPARPLPPQLMRLMLLPSQLVRAIAKQMPAAPSVGAIVLSVDGQWLKVVQVEGVMGSRRVTTLIVRPVEGCSSEEITKVLKDACAAEQLTGREVLAANPTHLSTLRLFSLPSTDPNEIRDIVALQAEKHTPYAKEEILTDFAVLDRHRSGFSRVLLVIVHQDVIQRIVRLVETGGLTLQQVGCEIEGLIQWFQLLKRRRGRAASDESATLVIEIDAATSTLVVMQRDQPQFHRSLATGIEQWLTDPASVGDRFVSELQRSIEAFESEGGAAKLGEVVVTGRVERLGELKSRLEHGLELPVTLVSPWEVCEQAEGVRAALPQLPDISCASLLGLALGPVQIDLTPQATKLQQAFETRAKTLVMLGCEAVALLLLVSLLIMGTAHKQQRYRAQLRRVYAQALEESVEVEAAMQQLAFVKARLSPRGAWLNAVEAIARRSPPEIHWESVTFSRGESVVLRGVADALPKLYEFVASLNGDPLFEGVETRRVAPRQADEEEGLTEFELICPLVDASLEAAG